MIDFALEQIIAYGIFSIAFFWLFAYTNKRNEKREEIYQHIIKENQRVIAEQAASLSMMSGDIRDIKYIIKGGVNRHNRSHS